MLAAHGVRRVGVCCVSTSKSSHSASSYHKARRWRGGWQPCLTAVHLARMAGSEKPTKAWQELCVNTCLYRFVWSNRSTNRFLWLWRAWWLCCVAMPTELSALLGAGRVVGAASITTSPRPLSVTLMCSTVVPVPDCAYGKGCACVGAYGCCSRRPQGPCAFRDPVATSIQLPHA